MLATTSTSPAFNVVLAKVGATVTDHGGVRSYAAIVAREFGIPPVVGCRSAVPTIADRARVRVDGDAGTASMLDTPGRWATWRRRKEARVRRISLSLPWNPESVDSMLEWAQDADSPGVDSIWINEGFGHDAFSGLTLMARETDRIALGTPIVNVFSRTPGALAQQFATIDQLSGGRVRVGLGASAPGAIERFHGLSFEAPLRRLRETTELLRLYWSRARFDYDGPVHSIELALPMGTEPVQESPPIYLATLHPRSVRLTAEVADGWLPAWIPAERLAGEIAQIRGWVAEAGRDASAFDVRAPGGA